MKATLKKVVLWIITWEARLVLRKYKPYIVAVTGNVGKTSTKDAIYTLLEKRDYVRKSEKSLNSEFGVPLTIIGRESGWNDPFKWLGIIGEGLMLILFKNHYPKTLVLEVGADHPGDIRTLTKWLKPDVAVVTGIPDVPVHVEYFDSPEELAREKEYLVEAVKPDGTIILNGDDARTRDIHSRYRTATLYGFDEGNEVTSSHEEVMYESGAPTGMRFRVNYKGSSVPFVLQEALGKTHILPILAACAVGAALNVDLASAGAALVAHQPPKGRMHVIPGEDGSTIIDDTYNSSPAAAASALETLRGMRTIGKKIAILGDMLELGKHSADAHRQLGEYAARAADMLVTVGVRAEGTAVAAVEAGFPSDRVMHFAADEAKKAGETVRSLVGQGDVVLVKGSQGMRMEHAVKALMAEPARAKELLVRQDPAWKVR